MGKMRRLYVIGAMVIVSLIVCGLAYFIAKREYHNTKAEILTAEEDVLHVWTENKAMQMNLWHESLQEQASRVSHSELYRLFAVDAVAESYTQSSSVQKHVFPNSSLIEQIPLMRSVLADFISINGYIDARIINEEGSTILSVQNRPSPMKLAQSHVGNEAIKNNKASFGLITVYDKGLLLHFADPLEAVLTKDTKKTAIAALILTTPVTSSIARFLVHDVGQDSFNPYVLQKNADTMEIVDVHSINFPKVTIEHKFTSGQDMPFTLRSSVANKDNLVWSYGKYIPVLDWWLITEVPSLVISNKLSKESAKIYGLAIALSIGFILLIALLWWIFVEREHKKNAERFENLYKLIRKQKHILDNVNSALDIGLLAVNVKGKITMVNRAFSTLCDFEYENIENENIALIFAPDFTYDLIAGIEKVCLDKKTFTAEYSAILKDSERLLRLTFFPFLSEDKESEREFKHMALITFTDITEFRRQSNAKRYIQEKSMQALVRAVESMDPYLSGHSERMQKLSRLICENLKLDEATTNTVLIAANLSQIGKLFIPRDLLLKTGKLTEDEKKCISSIPEQAWLTLKEIDFQLPVPQAVYAMYERLDGKGYPRKLKGDAIDIHARILGIVNTFCAMTTPRAYRDAKSVWEAVTLLREDEGYDVVLVNALENILKTKEGFAVTQSLLSN